MRKMACRDVGMNCDFVATGNSDEEVLRKATEHGRANHGMTQITPDLEQKIRQQIKNA